MSLVKHILSPLTTFLLVCSMVTLGRSSASHETSAARTALLGSDFSEMSPVDSTSRCGPVELSWKNPDGTMSYEVKIYAYEITTGSIVFSGSGVGLLSDPILFNGWPGRFVWVVTARDSQGNTRSSAQMHFTMTAPRPPILSAPLSGAVFVRGRDSSITLNWSPSSTPVHYEISVSNLIGGVFVFHSDTNAYQLSLKTLAPQEYVWRVRGFCDSTHSGGVSLPSNFTLTTSNALPDDPDHDPPLRCYPNPFQAELRVSLSCYEDINARCYVMNNVGEIVYLFTPEQLRSGSCVIDAQTSDLSSGTYHVVLHTSHSTYHRSCVLVR